MPEGVTAFSEVQGRYPDQEELLAVPEENLLDWIDAEYLRHDPYAFEGHDFRKVARSAAGLLDVDPNGIYCLGSGAVGLSLNPAKIQADGSLKRFDSESDLDLAVISSHYFDLAWRDLRRASQPTLNALDKDFRDRLSHQRKRLFDGAVLADKVMPMLTFRESWHRALGQLSQQIAITLDRNVPVHVWIYRDYWGVRNYVSEGILKCRKGLA